MNSESLIVNLEVTYALWKQKLDIWINILSLQLWMRFETCDWVEFYKAMFQRRFQYFLILRWTCEIIRFITLDVMWVNKKLWQVFDSFDNMRFKCVCSEALESFSFEALLPTAYDCVTSRIEL